jgi:mono/diheme cytochrome c family protein
MRSWSIVDRASIRRFLASQLVVVLGLLGGSAATFAQDVENGQRLAERLCAACHATGNEPTRFKRAPSFAAIAARQDVSSDMITSFLLLPHATMPNAPLSRKNALDIAAFIMDMRK